MTDRINALTVVLDRDIRDDDVREIIQAIRMIKCVATVTPHVADHDSHVAYVRARMEIEGRLYEALKDPHQKVG